MTKPSIFVFDFDGVLIDGIKEYWLSSRNAALSIKQQRSQIASSYIEVPRYFKDLRPLVQHGWEMVLLAEEIMRSESELRKKGVRYFSKNYKLLRDKALLKIGLSSEKLQEELEKARRESIAKDLNFWLSSHVPFTDAINQLALLRKEDIEPAILTTKGAEFTNKILSHLGVNINLVYGHESGSKIERLRQLSNQYSIKGFLEDRRATLEKVLNTPEICSIPCYLANWGYLKPDDTVNIPTRIQLIDLKTLSRPLSTRT